MAASGAIITAIAPGAPSAQAHGFAGARFFPPTIQTDDPFVADELALPTVSTFKTPGDPATRETDVGVSFSKLIFPNFALGAEENYIFQTPEGGSTVSGFDNLGLNAKCQLWVNAPYESIFSVGADWDVGGTGAKKIGADSANTFTPTIYFGKGFGDLPDALNYVKPFALTGVIGEALPTSAAPDSLEWGFALEYSLPYMESQMKDIGLPAPFKNMIPLVEFSFETPENRGGGPTTGTINPGVLWETKYFQLGAEAIIPANSDTGSEVGAVFQIQFYLDDLLPTMFGRPIFWKSNSY
ncbi:MAG: hypothetical protein KGJ60_02415 [Verrucomicrobiota bacterium]|nr:hypothetical protein [Verrucomicrobiota bacterium]